MGKSSKRKRQRKFQDYNYSGIKDHKQKGKTLVTSFGSIGIMKHLSWRDDYAPELLWAFLLAAVFPRDTYLGCFREIARWYRNTFPPVEGDSAEENQAADQAPIEAPADLDLPWPLDHTALAELSDEHFAAFLEIPLRHPLGYGALRPLLLLDSLPGIERWRKQLDVEPTEQDWDTLRDAVIGSLDHQSEKSTDVRWLKVVVFILGGKMRFPGDFRERILEIMDFPNKGDMRSVRPSIRSLEMAMRRTPPEPWIKAYWDELLEKTDCVDASSDDDYFSKVNPTLTRSSILEMRLRLRAGFLEATTSTLTDPRLDATFGFVLYALSLLEEIAAPPNSLMLVGRMALRSLTETVITFTYLVKKDDPALWKAYRNYGNGQAKLAFLKMEETAGDMPKFVDQETLHLIANEDRWQEFVDIDFGNWAKKNLRDLASEGGTKDLYDHYYDWTSNFMHAQWGAVRDSNFITCYNSLHRLHRIPRPYHRILPTVVPDAVKMVNMTLELLEAAYPKIESIGRIVEMSPEDIKRHKEQRSKEAGISAVEVKAAQPDE